MLFPATSRPHLFHYLYHKPLVVHCLHATAMFSPTMRTALLQAIVLWTISMMLDHHYYQNIFSQVIENEAVISLNNALNISHSTSTSSTPGQLALDAGNTTNITLSLNHTLGLANATAPRLSNAAKQPQESFYRQLLPREAFVFLVVSALQYWWHIFLERILPARPKSRSAPSEKEVEHSEDREEEVVKKWVAQGRVRRSSLNWCNTFLKWVLELTVGRLWYHSVSHGVRILLKPEDPKLPLRGLKSVSHLSSFRVLISLTVRYESTSQ
jgi:hypothetical protein